MYIFLNIMTILYELLVTPSDNFSVVACGTGVLLE